MVTQLDPDILECEVKWALESISMNKASGGDRIPAELFQIIKADAVKVLHSFRKFGKLSSGYRTVKISFHSNSKDCSSYNIMEFISHTSKVMLKILQARLYQCVN